MIAKIRSRQDWENYIDGLGLVGDTADAIFNDGGEAYEIYRDITDIVYLYDRGRRSGMAKKHRIKVSNMIEPFEKAIFYKKLLLGTSNDRQD